MEFDLPPAGLPAESPIALRRAVGHEPVLLAGCEQTPPDEEWTLLRVLPVSRADRWADGGRLGMHRPRTLVGLGQILGGGAALVAAAVLAESGAPWWWIVFFLGTGVISLPVGIWLARPGLQRFARGTQWWAITTDHLVTVEAGRADVYRWEGFTPGVVHEGDDVILRWRGRDGSLDQPVRLVAVANVDRVRSLVESRMASVRAGIAK